MGAEFRERVCERMHGAAVLEVANQDDVLALERAAFVPDRGRFVENRGEDLALESPRALLADGDRHHLPGGPQNELDVRPREVADREDVPPLEGRHRAPYS